jgi:hypothetical protein
MKTPKNSQHRAGGANVAGQERRHWPTSDLAIAVLRDGLARHWRIVIFDPPLVAIFGNFALALEYDARLARLAPAIRIFGTATATAI